MSDSEYIFCQNCGEKIPASSKFCGKCGAKNDYSIGPDGNLVKTASYQDTQYVNNVSVSTYSSSQAYQAAPKKKKGVKVIALILAALFLVAAGAGIARYFSKGNDNGGSNTSQNPPVNGPGGNGNPNGNSGSSGNNSGNTSNPPVSPQVGNKAMGCIIIVDGPVNIRKSASTSSDKNGMAYNAEAYDVYEIKTSGDYTWYRIGTDQWVANNGQWGKYIDGGKASDYPAVKNVSGHFYDSTYPFNQYYPEMDLYSDGTCVITENTGEGMAKCSGTFYVKEGKIYVTLASDSYVMQYYGWNNINTKTIVFDISSVDRFRLETKMIYAEKDDVFKRK